MALRTNRAIATVGPRASGKSALLRLVTAYLNKFEGKALKYSIMSPSTFSHREFFGSNEGNFSSENMHEGVLSVVMKSYENERASSTVKTLLFDGPVEEAWSESLLNFVVAANAASSLCHASTLNETHRPSKEGINVLFPNGLTVRFPADLFVLFETEALGQASPRFATLVSFVFTREQSVSWKMLVQKQTTSIFDSNASFFKMLAVPRSFLESLFQEFLVPFIVKADAVLATKDCEYWDVKRLSGAHCRLFAAHIHKLKSIIKSLQQEQTKSVQQLLFIQKNAQQILSGFFLASAFHSFGAVLPLKLKRLFEDAFLAMRHPIAASVKVSAH